MMPVEQAPKDPIQMLKDAADKMHLASCAIVKHLFGLEEKEPAKDDKKEKIESIKIG